MEKLENKMLPETERKIRGFNRFGLIFLIVILLTLAVIFYIFSRIYEPQLLKGTIIGIVLAIVIPTFTYFVGIKPGLLCDGFPIEIKYGDEKVYYTTRRGDQYSFFWRNVYKFETEEYTKYKGICGIRFFDEKGRRREIPLSKEVAEELQAYWHEHRKRKEREVVEKHNK